MSNPSNDLPKLSELRVQIDAIDLGDGHGGSFRELAGAIVVRPGFE